MNGGGGDIAVDSTESVLASIRRLQLDRSFTDCTLVASDSSGKEVGLECHRAMLASASPYFADELKTPGTVLQLTDYNANEIGVLVGFIYTGRAALHSENISRMYEISTRLGVAALSDACAQFLVEQANEGKMTLFQRLDIGLRLGVPKLVQPCMEELIAADASQLKTEDFLTLCEKAMRIFLLSEDLQVDEIALFRALIMWGKSRCPRTSTLGEFLTPFTPLIRYPLMTVAEIEDEVRQYEFVSRELLLDAAIGLSKNQADWDLSNIQFRQRNSVFVYRWRINWHAVRDMEEIWSDKFSFIFAGMEHKWKLRMYPNGKNAPNYISFFLYMDPEDTTATKWRKFVDFDFLLTDFSKRRRTQFFAKEPSCFGPDNPSWGFAKFRERHLVDNPKSSYVKDEYVEFELAMKMHGLEPV